MKDYYTILNIGKEANEQEIKKAYRTLALKYHPDRNKEQDAEQKFREITEAYGVLIDKKKRKEYDDWFASGRDPGTSPKFTYTQEDIFRDIFTNTDAADIFRELEKNFGIRFNHHTFHGGRGFFFGGVIFGGFFPLRAVLSPLVHLIGNVIKGQIAGDKREGQGQIKGIEHKKNYFEALGSGIKKLMTSSSPAPKVKGNNVYYTIPVSSDTAMAGGSVKISLPYTDEKEIIRVTIPKEMKDGGRLRLKGKGIKRKKDKEHGDLYLTIQIV